MKAALAIAVVLLFCISRADEPRVWTFQSKATVKGTFVEFSGTSGVTIQRADDKKNYVLPISKLSDEDQSYLDKLRKKQQQDTAFTVNWDFDEFGRGWCGVVNNSDKVGTLKLTIEIYDEKDEQRLETITEFFWNLSPHKSETKKISADWSTLVRSGLPKSKAHVKLVKDVSLK